LDELLKAIETMKAHVPLEIWGFLISAIVVVILMVVVGMVLYLQRRKETEGTPDTARVPKTSPKDKAKTREAARATGFIADDVERALPDISLDTPGPLQRQYCARYTYPEHIASNAEWALLQRPGHVSGTVAAGWQLLWQRGAEDAGVIEILAKISADTRWKKRHFEMELSRNALTFYWDEYGGKPLVDVLKSYFDQLHNQGVK
jgi:hypothetical protein